VKFTEKIKNIFKDRAGLTIIEMVVVVLIITALVSIMTPVLTNKVTEAKYAAVKAQIAELEVAIANYRNDLGAYPPTGITPLREALSFGLVEVSDPVPLSWKGPYIEIDEEMVNKNNGAIVDIWGNDLEYINNDDYVEFVLGAIDLSGVVAKEFFNPSSYQIYSMGKNGQTYRDDKNLAGTELDTNGREEDINNW
jgi:general secretion pathway protein G